MKTKKYGGPRNLEVSVLYRVVRRGLTERVVFEGVGHTLSRRRASEAEGIAKALRQEHTQLDHGKHTVVAGEGTRQQTVLGDN